MRLILVRHGETATDNPEKCHGFTDIDLSAEGYRQAEALQRRFANEHLDVVYCSTLIRGVNTASIVTRNHAVELVRCDELNEVNFGLIETITFEEACTIYPDVTELWRQGSTEICFPQGERFVDFDNRVKKFLDRLQHHGDDDTIMLVGHGGPFRILMCHLLGIPLRHYWQFRFSMASVSVVDVYPHGAMLEFLNDLSHIKHKEVNND
ncbi:alpha-ribazole-5'-phosphate phosphatase [Dehalogenimonas sp. WBC-2]|nr:alpha-ribazole-5'-phosphate phosphatase [Dehalogenimonas sp. WBC-2]